MAQYFIDDPSVEHEIVSFGYNFGKRKYTFFTDAGLFSRDHIDPESALLMSVVPRLNGSLLDLGCGYGCIGVILACEYGLSLTQVDVNPRALALAKRNCEENAVESEILLSDCFDALPERRFDTITLNPPIHAGKSVTYRMYEQAPEHLNPNGAFYVVTLKKHGAESTRAKLTEVFGNCETLYKKGGNFVFRCVKT